MGFFARIALLSVVACLLLAAPRVASAQLFVGPPLPPHPIKACVVARTPYLSDLRSSQGVEVADPEQTPTGASWSLTVLEMLREVRNCSLEFAVDEIVPMVRPWFIGFVIIMTVWMGVGMMFSGQFSPGPLISHVLAVGFAFALFEVYYSPTPVATLFGANQGFVHFVSDGADLIATSIFEQGYVTYEEAFEDAHKKVSERSEKLAQYDLLSIGQAWSRVLFYSGVGASTGFGAWGVGAIPGALIGALGGTVAVGLRSFSALENLIFSSVVLMTMWGFLLVLHIGYWIIMAQYMWSFFALSVLSIVGPIFIPLYLVPQLEEYFWGWLKAVVQQAFFMIIASVMFLIVSVLLTSPLKYITSNGGVPPDDPSVGLAGIVDFLMGLVLQYLPVIVAALMASLQIGALSNAMTSGAPPPGAGLLSRFTQAAAGAGAVASARGAVMNRYNSFQAGRADTLAASTRRRGQAVDRAKETLSSGPGSGGASPKSSSGGGGGSKSKGS